MIESESAVAENSSRRKRGVKGSIARLRYGKLVAVSRVPNKRVGWLCRCDCGSEVVTTSDKLTAGRKVDCGCVRREKLLAQYGTLDGATRKRIYLARWASAHKDELKKYLKRYHAEHRGEAAARYEANKDKNRPAKRAYFRRLRATNPQYRLALYLRNRLNTVLRRGSGAKSGHIEDMIGCSIAELRVHLESQFTEDMTWTNYGPFWHVDHRIPCTFFDITDPMQQRACFHFSNLRPLYWQDNLRKGAKLPHELIAA